MPDEIEQRLLSTAQHMALDCSRILDVVRATVGHETEEDCSAELCEHGTGRDGTCLVALVDQSRVKYVDGGAVRAGGVVVERVPHEQRERGAGAGEQQRQKRRSELAPEHSAPGLCVSVTGAK